MASAGEGEGVHIVLAVLMTTAFRTGLAGTAGVAANAEEEVGGTGDEDGLTPCVVSEGESKFSGDGEAGSAWCEKLDDCEAEAVD